MQLPSLSVRELYDSVIDLRAKKANEDDLKTTVHHFLKSALTAFPRGIKFHGEKLNTLGRPDIQVNLYGKLIGFIELKRPGKSADPQNFKGHDLEQWGKFKNFKNIIYTDGVSWNLYQNTRKVDSLIVSKNFEADLGRLLDVFCNAKPTPFVGIAEYANNLSSIRSQVAFYLENNKSNQDCKDITTLFGSTFFTNSSEPFHSVFSDFIITALASVKIIHKTEVDVYKDYNRISLSKYQSDFVRAIFSKYSKGFLAYPLSIISGHINDLDTTTYKSTSNALKGFFEAYLHGTRPSDKKQDGVFYTPEDLTNFHVRVAYEVAKECGLELDKLRALDPAAGTGTYSLALCGEYMKALSAPKLSIESKRLQYLLDRVVSFEINEGAALVASNKISSYVASEFSFNKPISLKYFITDTLLNKSLTQRSGRFNEYIKGYQTIIESAKKSGEIDLIIGNPPFHLHKDISPNAQKKIGSKGGAPQSIKAELDAATARLQVLGFHRDTKFLWDSAVFFLIWSIKRAESSYKLSGKASIVSLILPRTLISSKFATPIREKIISISDNIKVVDLGGEHRGAVNEYNVFGILKAVCILTFSVNGRGSDFIKYARVHADNEAAFNSALSVDARSVAYTNVTCTNITNYSFVPDTGSIYPSFTDLRDVVNESLNGIQLKRLWPVGITKETLEVRWRSLITEPVNQRASLYVENNSQKAKKTALDFGKKVTELDLTDPCPKIVRFGYRSFDYQWLLYDKGLAYSFRGETYSKHRSGQGYFVGHLTKAASGSCFLTFSDAVVDTDFHAKRGAKDVIPLLLTPGRRRNLADNFRSKFESVNGYPPDDFLFFALAVLSSVDYCNKFSVDTEKYGLRVPFIAPRVLYEELVSHGKDIATLNTLGNTKWGSSEFAALSPRSSKLLVAKSGFKLAPRNVIDEVGGTITGDGWSIVNVSPQVLQYKISGYSPVRSLVGYWTSSRSKARSKLDTLFPRQILSTDLGALLNTIHAIEGMLQIQAKLSVAIAKLI